MGWEQEGVGWESLITIILANLFFPYSDHHMWCHLNPSSNLDLNPSSLLLLLLSCFSHVQLCATPYTAAHQAPPVPGILQVRTLEWVAISFSNAWKWKVKVKSLSHLTLSNPMDLSLSGSSVHGIFQARVLEWGAIAFSGIPALPLPNSKILGRMLKEYEPQFPYL